MLPQGMTSAFRNAIFTAVSLSPYPRPQPNHFPLSTTAPFFRCILFSLHKHDIALRFPFSAFCSLISTPMRSDGDGEISCPTSPTSDKLEKQFEDFRKQLEDSGNLRDRIRSVVLEIESVTRLMHSSLLLVHEARPVPEVLEKAKAQIVVLRELFGRLAEILRECPVQYYRYHADWRSETQTVVSLLGFMHWLETGTLLLRTEAENKLGLNSSDFGLDVEDYLIGICFMSNEMVSTSTASSRDAYFSVVQGGFSGILSPRNLLLCWKYVVNQVTTGDFDCPWMVLRFLTELHAAFLMLNLQNDFLRKKFDSMKYDLRRVEEVYYDVKIRGLVTSGGPDFDQETNG